ncbi:Kinase-like protein [Mycena kentingensis (nom. inval.)]|nr:Kinase-like protein [Mycena kentingensis (nom. inval.)]
MSNLDPPVTLCVSLSGKTAGLDCGNNYPRKTTPGLCAGCTLCLNLSAADLDRVSAYPRCVDCGAMYRSMTHRRGNDYLCAKCANVGAPPPPPNPTQDQQLLHRTNRMANVASHKPNAATIDKLQTGGSGATMGMSANICVTAFLSGGNGKAVVLGSGMMMEMFNINAFMEDDVLEHFIKRVNVSWDARHEHSLTIDDVILRYHNNGDISTPLTGLTIRQFTDLSASAPLAKGIPSSIPAQTRKVVGVWPTFQAFEMHIQKDLYTRRTGEDVKMGGKNSTPAQGPKRKASGSLTAASVAKRGRNEASSAFVPVISQFVPRVAGAKSGAKTSVNLEVIGVTVDETTGEVRRNLRDRVPFGAASLHDTSLASGSMKTVHVLETSNATFVAKRFHQIAASEGGDVDVTVSENDGCIFEEVELLGQATYFLAEFYKRAKEARTYTQDLAELSYTTFHLCREVVPDDGEPTPASAVPADQIDAARTEGVTWLVEPYRPGRTIKFVGTLNHAAGLHNGKIAATVHAFIHFAYEFSNKSLVLVDVQGTKVNLGGSIKHVLFDPMAHTTSGESGPGDHGVKGIQDFLATHTCNGKCKDLKLQPLEPASDDEGVDSENDGE